MRKFILVATLSFTFAWSSGQVINSVSNGNWFDPDTWDCSCVPGVGSDIVVGHSVFADGVVGVQGGSLTVEASAVLSVSTGALFLQTDAYVMGYIECEFMTVDAGGVSSLINFGTIDCLVLDVLTDELQNAGYITIQEDMLLSGSAENMALGEWDAYDISGSGTFINHGYAVLGTDQFMGRMINDGMLIVDANGAEGYINSITNAGELTLAQMELDTLHNSGVANTYTLVMGKWYQGQGQLQVIPFGGDLHVEPGAIVTVDAPGWIHVVDGDLYNAGIMAGDGHICVSDITSNIGSIQGMLDVCDGSPTASSPPFIDQNTGTVDTSVTFCESSPCATVVPEVFAAEAVVLPAPGMERVILAGLPMDAVVIVLDAAGRHLISVRTAGGGRMELPVAEIADGIYRVVLIGKAGRRVLPMVLVR